VADEAQVKLMVKQVVSTFGRLDAAFNNAGVQSPVAETTDASEEDFDRVMAINLRGVRPPDDEHLRKSCTALAQEYDRGNTIPRAATGSTADGLGKTGV
jgi:NAD(P)-dependent dehydrogenase (short-subunit alcohol dehydrogenase family)